MDNKAIKELLTIEDKKAAVESSEVETAATESTKQIDTS